MTEEIVRELVDGVWQTRLADASAGGGVPDPSAAPDGDVITVSSGAYVLAPGGGSQPVILNSASVHVSAAAMLTLDSIPVELVPVSAGNILIPRSLTAKYTPGDTAYTMGGSFGVNNDVFGATMSPLTELEYAVTTTDSWATWDEGTSPISTAGISPAAGAAGNISFKATGSPPTLGNGTLDLIVTYLKVPFP